MCGIVGQICKYESDCMECYEALLSIQHRGQDGAGISYSKKNESNSIIGKGLICNIFQYDDLKNSKGMMFLGHTRYKTNEVANSFQPFQLNNEKMNMYMCHNGNIINVNTLKSMLKKFYKVNIQTVEMSDSLVLFHLIFNYINFHCKNISKLTSNILVDLSIFLHENVNGSYNILLTIQNYGLVVFKDKWGVRPLIYGNNDNNDILISSESCSFNNVPGYKNFIDVKPGETIIFKLNRNDDPFQHQYQYRYYNALLKPCLFEYIYFARLDSIINNISVYKFRFLLGNMLGKIIKDSKIHVDFVIPTPETSRVYAYGLSEYTGIPIQECIIKNRYVNRTFIIENKNDIKKNIKRKFSVINEVVKGKKVLLIDDSIVRGNTSREVVNLLKEAGANRVYFGSAAPKIVNTNKYGIHIEKKLELISTHCHTNEKIAKAIGVEKIFFNDLNNVINLTNSLNKHITTMEVSMFND